MKSYWDKEKKAPRNKQVCLGRVDTNTNEIVPSKRRKKIVERAAAAPGVTVTSRVAGPFLLLERLTQEHGLEALLEKCFPEDHQLILSLVYYIVHKGGALSRAESWSASCLHPFDDVIPSQRISELLARLSEDERQRFLSLWLAHVQENDWLCYDITSVSSYARHNEYTHFGYNRDGESLPQINLAMLFGQKSRLPVHYRRLPGNISDVTTLRTTAKSLDYLGSGGLHFVLDHGFYSKANIDDLFARRHKFTIAVPAGRKWVEKILDKHCDNITSPRNYIMTSDDHREIRKQKLLIMGMVVLALGVSCSDSGQEEWGAVSGLSPADGASTTDTTPDLSWTEVPDAKGYEVRIADSEAELDQNTPRPVTGSSYTPTVALTNNQTHYWKVRAKDAGEQYGPWSVVQSLKVEWGVVSGLSPADDASTTDTTPTFSWDAVPGAAGYELQMADSLAGLESSNIQSVTDTLYTPASALTNEQTRY